MRTKLLFALLPLLFLNSQFAHADVVIEYSDVGSDLVFSWSGSLNIALGDGFDPPGGPSFATIGVQGAGNEPTFYSAPQSQPPISTPTYTGPNNPGLFATTAPPFGSGIMPGSTSTGLPFMFRVNNAVSGTTFVQMWGDWGAANTPITGTMTIANQSIASMGMVNGYTIGLSVGNISFQASQVPEPSSFAFLGLAAMGMAYRRKKKQAA